jgi:cytochrome c-type biogenesis protein
MNEYYLSMMAALAGGILSFVSPCVLPLVPGYLSFAAGLGFDELSEEHQSQAIRRRIFFGTLAFVLGFSTVFILLGASASAISGLLLAYKDTLSQIAGGAIILLGIHMTGVIRIPFLMREMRVQGPDIGTSDDAKKRSNMRQQVVAYFIGVAFAFGWTPCIGPILATILTLAAGQEHILKGVGLLAIYAAGLAIPFLLSALAVGRFMATSRNIKKYMRWIEWVAGTLLIVTGILILMGSLQSLASYLLDWFPFMSRLG